MKKILFLLFAACACLGVNAEGVKKLNATTAEVELADGQRVYIDFYGPQIFRLFQDPKGGILRDPQASPEARILVDHPRRDVSISVTGNEVSSGKITVSIDTKTGALDVNGNGVSGLSISGADFSQKGKTSISLSQHPNEYFFGGGVQNGHFSHRGETIYIENTNNWVEGGVASPEPFYWSTAGYGVMGYTFAPGKYDFGAKEQGKTILMHETDYLDYFFMIDRGAVALLDDYYQLTGNPVLLPKFGFYEGHLNAYNRDYWTEKEGGFMQFEDGKRYSESQKDNGGIHESLNGENNNYQFSARAALDRYLNNDMPLGWFLPNDGYGAGYGQTGSLEGNVENLKQFGDYARSKGVEIGLWTQSDLHPKEGVEPLLQRDIVREVRDAGVRVLKTDVAWVGAGYSFGLNGVADVAQIMPYYGSQARPFIISLDGWAGTQRYAGIWTGDQTGGEWEYIRFHIPTYIGSGLSGQPNITSDMDGIFGGKNLPVNVRDFQWKTFTPMQLNMDGWGMNPKYPQALGDTAAQLNRWYLHLKSALMPYTYSIAHEAVTGKPIIRAMFLEDEANAFTMGTRTQYQFMYGPSILVAPIYKETRADKQGNDVRDGIYLPQGQWMDAFTGQLYQGGRILNDFDAPLWKLPILLKTGAIIPMTQAHNTPSQARDNQEIDLLVVPGAKSSFNLYDDDGKTDAYLRGQSANTLIESELNAKGKLTVTLHATQGSFEGMQAEKSIRLRVPMAGEPKKVAVKVDGKKVNFTGAFTSHSSLFAMDSEKVTVCNIPQVGAYLAEITTPVDMTKHTVTIEMEGVKLDTTNPLLQHEGTLEAPKTTLNPTEAYSLTPTWEAVQNADYYEVQFEGQTYSNILQTSYTIDGLNAETAYDMQVRAVNASGASDWTTVSASTTSDPLQYAIHGARGTTSCDNQQGQSVRHLFDFDETTTWHTKWGEAAVPFDLTIDLHSVNQLDKLQYVPRTDAGNGTLMQGTIEYSADRVQWTKACDFNWEPSADVKEATFAEHPTARYIRIHVTQARGNFGSGQQIYVFRVPGSDYFIPGDINLDGRLDENDLTSYMNYTGLRQGDGDFQGYVSKGDLNQNGLIDVYDISAVATELESGVSSRKIPALEGQISVATDKAMYNAGDDVTISIIGKGMKSINGISLCLPYDASKYEYVGVKADGIPQMYNMTYDRLHTNGQKALYPTFVNIGENDYAEGDKVLFTITFRTKVKGKFPLKYTDGMIVDKSLNVVKF